MAERFQSHESACAGNGSEITTFPVILIAGGKDKGLDYVPLRPMLKEKVRACVVFGQIADQLQHAFSPQSPRKKPQM
ncbi:hypothetical protein M5E88_06160 [Akkermansia muciniphila]|nr:hypothetical protein M5E88_06160 [Akkermansia muciniphila]